MLQPVAACHITGDRHAVHALVCTGDMLRMLCYAQYLLAKTACLPGGLVSKMFSGLMSA